MENVPAINSERGPRAAICTRCGGDAEWVFVNSERTRVEVHCPDCGKFEMSRADFDRAESEIVEPEER